MLKQHNFFMNIDIPWKTFVRESCEVSEVPIKRKDHCLSFQGDEARESYEEIVHDTEDVISQHDQKHRKARTNINHSTISKSVSTERSKSEQFSKGNVTVNAILKAVEQKDLMFLSRYVTQENVDSTDDFGWTPLMSAAYCGHLDVIEFLLNLGANRRAREKSGLTAAQLALKKNYLNIVALLKKRTEHTTNRSTLPEADANTSQPNSDYSLQIKPEFVEPLKDFNDTSRKIDSVKKHYDENSGFYCKICKVNFYQTTWKKHETSTLHVFNSKPKLTNTMYGISKQNKGYQMLLNHGWDEQNGLGPSGKGLKYPIKTCLKSDRKGLGQINEKEYRVTHFKPGDVSAISDLKPSKHK
ncbi:G patch domain and ankyrin repeat-containing protein 1 homolog isoform X2 [Ceratina calcarata]|nr:G patch domain and ankyrin repeat-containing protein 1 homolog isoform X2 [Ceratina calcarata]